MTMTDTKQKIISSAEKLFFSQGIGNVRLQQIADDAGISVGNLAYHFKNKEAIVQAVYDKMFEEFSDILSSYLQTPDLSDFDHLFNICYHFFTNNAFYLNNIWEINRSYDEIRTRWEQVNTKMMAQIKKRIEFNGKRGILNAALLSNTLDDLVQTLWLTITFWMPQQLLLGKRNNILYRKALWNQLAPYLTNEGKKEFEEKIILS
jgi:AcrR family transcriptional regulator